MAFLNVSSAFLAGDESAVSVCVSMVSDICFRVLIVKLSMQLCTVLSAVRFLTL